MATIIPFARPTRRFASRALRGMPIDPVARVTAIADRIIFGRADRRDWYEADLAETHRAVVTAVNAVRRG